MPQRESDQTLAVIVGEDVRLLSSDGSSRSVLNGSNFFSGISGVHFAGRVGDYFAVEGYPDGETHGMRVAVVSSTGSVKWQQTFDWSEAAHSDSSWVSLGSDGTVVFQRHDALLSALSLDERSADFSGGEPLGESVGGFVPVERVSAVTETTLPMEYGWWEIGGGSSLVAPDTYRGSDALVNDNPVFFGNELLHLTESAGQVTLVARSPAKTTAIPIPGARATTSIRYNEAVASPEDQHWLLVSTGAPNELVRVDLSTAASYPAHLVAPAGYRSFSNPCQDSDSSESLASGIDNDGYIYGVLRTDDHAAVFTTLDGEHWSQLGGSLTAIGGLALSVYAGTYVIEGRESLDCYGEPPTWSSAGQADFSGNLTQIIRRASGARLLLHTDGRDEPYQYSRTGRYAARWESDTATRADTLRVIDLETSTTTDLATDSTNDHSQPQWLSPN